MKTILRLLSTFLLLAACNYKDDPNSFISVDVVELNKKIEDARSRNESWIQTPYLIVNQLFGPVYNSEGHQVFVFEQHEKETSLTVIVTHEGLLDDSVKGEKRIIDFKYENDKWVIVKLRLGFKCYASRGHANYSGQNCN